MTDRQATDELQRCCGSRRWAERMCASRPFKNLEELFHVSDDIWWGLAAQDWLEAFSHHPKIGGNVDALRKKFAPTAEWSKGEQAGVTSAGQDVLQALADGNQEYERKFGYIFIVCATGKTAAEMLAILKERLPGKPEEEMKIAAGEQNKITRIRLEKLCHAVQSQPTS
jgi:2-oxo-4-hydroxy-4-carboxy-5-ureidoimidazoline decarboxylase